MPQERRQTAAFALLLSAFALVCFVPTQACAPRPVTITTPQGKAAFTADQIAIRVRELGETAIQAEATGGMTRDTARTIVSFCQAAAPVLRSVPQGWAQTIQQAWSETKAGVGVVSNPAVAAAMSAVDVVLATEAQ